MLPVEQQEPITPIFTKLNLFRMIACSLPESCVQSKYSRQIQTRLGRGFHAASCDSRATPQSLGRSIDMSGKAPTTPTYSILRFQLQ